MHSAAGIIEANAVRIAEAATEYADVEGMDEAVRTVVLQLARNFLRQTPLNISSLTQKKADPLAIVRLFRGIEAESIEVLRDAYSGGDFGEIVVNLRKCMRNSRPKSPLNPDGVHLYQGLIGAAGDIENIDNHRLYGLFKGILSTIRDLVYVHDMRGNLLFVNDQGLEMTRYTRDDLVEGMTVFDFVVPRYIDIVEERLSAHPGKLSPCSIEIYTKDGDRIPIEIDTRVLLNDAGRPDAVVGVARDLRLERRLQDEIARTNRSLDRLLHEAPVGVIICDSRGVVQEINPCAMVLCEIPAPNALIGHHLLTVCSPNDDDVAELRYILESALVSRRRVQQRVAIRTRFGADLACEVTATPLEGEDPSELGVMMLLCVAD